MSKTVSPVRLVSVLLAGGLLVHGCSRPAPPGPPSPAITNPATFWNAATVYFLLTDRFNNGDSSNDRALGRAQDGAVLRSFLGGEHTR